MVKLIEKDTEEIINLESAKINNQIEDEILNKAVELVQFDLKNSHDENKDSEIIRKYLNEVKKDVISYN